jgi:hypothetical protein
MGWIYYYGTFLRHSFCSWVDFSTKCAILDCVINSNSTRTVPECSIIRNKEKTFAQSLSVFFSKSKIKYRYILIRITGNTDTDISTVKLVFLGVFFYPALFLRVKLLHHHKKLVFIFKRPWPEAYTEIS